MHEAPAPDDYAWPTCTTPRCGRQLFVSETGRYACRPCEDTTAARIAGLPALFQTLNTTAALMRGARKVGGGSSGTKTPPIPPRLEVLALVGPGGAAARLAAIEDAWRAALGWTIAPWRGSATQALPKHVGFLTNNLLWACSSYEEVGQDIDDIRKLHGEMKAIAEQKPRFGDVKIGLCPVLVDGHRCAEQLYASARSAKTACSTCRSSWKGESEWRQLRSAQEAVLAEMAGVAA